MPLLDRQDDSRLCEAIDMGMTLRAAAAACSRPRPPLGVAATGLLAGAGSCVALGGNPLPGGAGRRRWWTCSPSHRFSAAACCVGHCANLWRQLPGHRSGGHLERQRDRMAQL